jgi:NAD(P)-dependent dehydrogenase (short-subunit alcohol dehydrogenase family)
MTQPHLGNVFITGSAAGVGAATTRLLVAAGYTVYAGVHKDVGTLEQLADVRLVPIDVSDPHSVAAAAEQVSAHVGAAGLSAVINNAGLIVQGPLELVPPEQLRRQFEVNTFGPAYVAQAFLPLLRAGSGRLINISAPTARVAVPFMAPIGASKAAVASLSDALRLELAAWGIPVVVVEPGGTQTEIFAKAEADMRTWLAAADSDRVALYRNQLAAFGAAAAKQKLGQVEPVAKVIVKAVGARRPKRHYAAGKGVALFGVLAHLPAGLRERLLTTVFGLRRTTPASAR